MEFRRLSDRSPNLASIAFSASVDFSATSSSGLASGVVRTVPRWLPGNIALQASASRAFLRSCRFSVPFARERQAPIFEQLTLHLPSQRLCLPSHPPKLTSRKLPKHAYFRYACFGTCIHSDRTVFGRSTSPRSFLLRPAIALPSLTAPLPGARSSKIDLARAPEACVSQMCMFWDLHPRRPNSVWSFDSPSKPLSFQQLTLHPASQRLCLSSNPE